MTSSTPTILGLLFEGGDPAAALIRGGDILALAEEERFNRVKHSKNIFPAKAAQFCLDRAGITVADLDAVAVGWDAHKFPAHMDEAYARIREYCGPLSERALKWQQTNRTRYTGEVLLAQLDEHLFAGVAEADRPEVRFIPHHYTHACGAFLLSGFEDACVITADGHGEEDAAHIFDAGPDGVRDLQQWDLPHSLGWFYTKFTQFFGFRAHDGEGKLMGLAAYGTPDPKWTERVGKVLRLTGDERVYEISSRFFFGEFAEGESYTPEWLELFGQPLARGDARLMDQDMKNLALAVQKVLEDAGAGLMRRAMELTGKKRVCVAGGSFMNCKMNGELARMVGEENFFALPLAGDNGVSIGAALAAGLDMGADRPAPLRHLYYGPDFTDAEFEAALSRAGLAWTKPEDLPAEAARLLAESKVVGWFQGRMEAGARALGDRSILGNPLDPKIRDLINAKVKFRELWRPFCPSTTEEDGPEYFDYQGRLPYMIQACEARPGMDKAMPSVVHCDNTVRVQSVGREENPPYHRLISEFKRLTGYGVVLNTSFNVKGEPIVCTPDDAIATFLKSGMDYLAMGDYLVKKEQA